MPREAMTPKPVSEGTSGNESTYSKEIIGCWFKMLHSDIFFFPSLIADFCALRSCSCGEVLCVKNDHHLHHHHHPQRVGGYDRHVLMSLNSAHDQLPVYSIQFCLIADRFDEGALASLPRLFRLSL